MSGTDAMLTPWLAPSEAARRYHVMIKPVGAICNLNCTYCYYLHKEQLLGSKSKSHISGEILENHIRQYIEGQDGSEVVFTWQGGEPTFSSGPLSYRGNISVLIKPVMTCRLPDGGMGKVPVQG